MCIQQQFDAFECSKKTANQKDIQTKHKRRLCYFIFVSDFRTFTLDVIQKKKNKQKQTND